MELPYIKKLPKYKINNYIFKGIDLRDNALNGSVNQCMNISSAQLPCLVPTKTNGNPINLKPGIKACISTDGKLAYISGKEFYYDGIKKGDINSDNPQMEIMGDYIIIAPEMSYYKISENRFSNLEYSKDYKCKISFNRLYSSNIDGWNFGGGVFDYISVSGEKELEKVFMPGDVVTLEFDSPIISENYITNISKSDFRVEWAKDNKIYFPVNTFKLSEITYSGEDSTLYGGVQITDTTVDSMKLTKKVVKLNYICEKNNRLWGCNENTIYASKLGNPLVYMDYQGLATDSWTLEVGTEENFTGCISTQSYVLFFKENYIYKIYGNMPQNFQSIMIKGSGVRKDSSKSLCSYNGTVFYLSNNGVMMFLGNEPYRISKALGNTVLNSGVGVTDGSKYYLSVKENDIERLMVYDIEKKIWLEEKAEKTVCFYIQNNEIKSVSYDGTCIALHGGNKYSVWSVTFGDFYENMYERKHYGKVLIHFELGEDAYFKAEISINGNIYKEYFSTYHKGRRSVSIPIKPNMSEFISIRLSGHGYCKIFAISRELRRGSVGAC